MKILLLHGWPVSERIWVSQVSALRDAGFDPVAPHLYGRGGSIDDWAAQLLREIDGSLVVVGASMPPASSTATSSRRTSFSRSLVATSISAISAWRSG